MRSRSLLILICSGQFSLAQMGDIHPIVRNPLPMAAGDVDGDGVQEAIMSQSGGVAVWDLSGSPVQLTMMNGILPSGAMEKWLVEDLDGDGAPDLIAGGPVVYFMKGLPGLLFDASDTLLATPWPVNDLFAADLDGDLLPDLVLVQASPLRTVHWSRNLGGGSFGAIQVIGAGTGPCGPGNFGLNSIVAIADLDLDLDQDIVLLAPSLTGFLNDGSGSFTMQAVGGLSGNALAVFDVDGDLLPDVLAPEYGQGVRWQRNLGGGSFTAPLATGVNEINGIEGLTTCDQTGDGLQDLIVHRPGSICIPDAFTIAPNIGAMDLGPEFSCGLDFDVLLGVAAGQLDGDPVEEFLWYDEDGLHVNIPVVIESTSAASAAVVDLDLSGSPDVVLATGAIPAAYCSYVHQLATSYSDGSGNFSLPTEQLISEHSGIRIIRAANFDGDSLLDLVALTSSMGSGGPIVWFKGMGGGLFDSVAQITVQYDGMEPLTGDVDGDGDMDVVSLDAMNVEVHLNDGAGIFTTTAYAFNNGWPGPMCLTDLDNDGDPDYAMSGNQLVWAPNDGSGTPGAMQIIDPDLFGHPFGPTCPIRAADLDLDGNADLVIATLNGSIPHPITVVLNDGGGTFQPATTWDFTFGSQELTEMQVGDIDLDGYPDILTLHDNILGYYKNDGYGNFTVWDSLRAGVGGQELILVDMDGDGDPDVLTGPVWVENEFPLLPVGVVAGPGNVIQITPNPARDQLLVSFATALDAGAHIDLLDVHGRIVRSLNGNGSREIIIERGDLQAGMYTVRVMDRGSTLESARMIFD